MSLTDTVGNAFVSGTTTFIDHTPYGEPGFIALTAATVGTLAWGFWKWSNPHRGQDPRPVGVHTGTALVDLGNGPVRVPAARPDAGTTLMLAASAPQTNVGPDGQSAYDTVGVNAIRTAVDQFYALVTCDPVLSPYFALIDLERLHRHQALFIGQLWGGPVHFDLDKLVTAHRHLQIPALAYWRTVGILMTVLTRLEVPDWICQFTLSALYDIRGKVINEQPET